MPNVEACCSLLFCSPEHLNWNSVAECHSAERRSTGSARGTGERAPSKIAINRRVSVRTKIANFHLQKIYIHWVILNLKVPFRNRFEVGNLLKSWLEKLSNPKRLLIISRTGSWTRRVLEKGLGEGSSCRRVLVALQVFKVSKLVYFDRSRIPSLGVLLDSSFLLDLPSFSSFGILFALALKVEIWNCSTFVRSDDLSAFKLSTLKVVDL